MNALLRFWQLLTLSIPDRASSYVLDQTGEPLGDPYDGGIGMDVSLPTHTLKMHIALLFTTRSVTIAC